MTEAHVYVCTWKKVGSFFHVALRDRPAVAAKHRTFAAADELLHDAITAATGDGENRREYVPPRPMNATPDDGIRSRLILVIPQARATIIDPERLFEGGLCPQCYMPRGPRTHAPLTVGSIPRNVDGGAAQIRKPLGAGPRLRFFSGAFLDQLTTAERRRLEWREVDHPAKARNTFFELLGGQPLIPFVALYNVGSASLTVCDACGYKRPPFYSFHPEPPSRYVSQADLPERTPSVFTVGDTVEPTLGMTPARWKKLVGAKGTRDIMSSDVGVLDPDYVDADPPRSPLSEGG